MFNNFHYVSGLYKYMIILDRLIRPQLSFQLTSENKSRILHILLKQKMWSVYF